MKKKFTRFVIYLCVAALTLSCLASTACSRGNSGRSNEETPLVLSSEALDGVFNPFFYSAGADGEIVGYTQASMLSSDENGVLIANWEEPSVALAFSVVPHGDRSSYEATGKYDDYYTDYYFAIKDDIKFSDGTPLTMHDVLFNMYMVLDPAYTGINTLYSVNIQGLNAYRDQVEDEAQQGGDLFGNQAQTRIDNIITWTENDIEGDWNTLTEQMEKDILKAHEFFREELETDWAATVDTAHNEEYDSYTDKDGKRIFNDDWQIFLWNYGHIQITPKKDTSNKTYYEYVCNYDVNNGTDKASILEYCYNAMFMEYEDATENYKQNLRDVLQSYNTGEKLFTYIRSSIMHDAIGDELNVKSVKGIKVLSNQSSIPAANGGSTQLKDKSGNAKSYDVLNIRIDGEDPKAIQNFSFVVAPGHYYSTSELWQKALADTAYEKDFGVSWSDPDFMAKIQQNQLPLGAGPYKAANSDNNTAKSKAEFFTSENIVYMVRNDYFMLGKAKIRKLRFKVVSTEQLYNEVKTGEVHFSSPQAKKTTVDSLNGTDKDILNYALSDNLGYGYVGINADKVRNVWVRRAIMTTLNPQLTVEYYGGSEYASVITRPMSKTLVDYYPNATTYAYKRGNDTFSYGYDETGATALRYARDLGGCTLGAGGKLVDTDGKTLRYTFTVAGESEDHPAFNMLTMSAAILNNIGFDITVTKDSRALAKLANGELTVWAAAWSSSSDPDMFQVYHKKSTATSIKAWGYSYLTGNEADDYQRGIVDNLSDLIDEGRESTEVSVRKPIYAAALDKLMELAVEFPTYQRKSLYVWPKGVFDEDTIYTGTEVTAYRSPLSEIWKVSFKEA